jgi:hypothetical protein
VHLVTAATVSVDGDGTTNFDDFPATRGESMYRPRDAAIGPSKCDVPVHVAVAVKVHDNVNDYVPRGLLFTLPVSYPFG